MSTRVVCGQVGGSADACCSKRMGVWTLGMDNRCHSSGSIRIDKSSICATYEEVSQRKLTVDNAQHVTLN